MTPVSVVNGNTSSASRLRRRSSIGSMPSSWAAWSTRRSSSAVASGSPGAAVGAHRRRVGDGDGDVELDRREAVRAVRHPLRAGRQEGADAGVGAGVADEVDAQPGERAVARSSRARRTGSGPGCGGATRGRRCAPATTTPGRSRWRAAAATAEYSAQIAGLAAEAAADLRADRRGCRRGPSRARWRAGRAGRAASASTRRTAAAPSSPGTAAQPLVSIGDDGDALVDVAAAHDDVADRSRGRGGRRWRRAPGCCRGRGRSPARRRRSAASGSTIGSSGS